MLEASFYSVPYPFLSTYILRGRKRLSGAIGKGCLGSEARKFKRSTQRRTETAAVLWGRFQAKRGRMFLCEWDTTMALPPPVSSS